MRIVRSNQIDDLVRGGASRRLEAEEAVKPILDEVSQRGDAALLEFARRFDGFRGECFLARRAELERALDEAPPEFLEALRVARANIERFARLQMPREFKTELALGHTVGQIVRPVSVAAAYIPGGRYPLPSTVLMACIPAQVAGVPHIWITSPQASLGTDAAAALLGVSKVARLGGAHAIAAFAFGTESIPRADRIVGPGNAYVAAAKKLLAGEVAIDFVAGPTEVLIVASDGNPAWIAADLLAQCEHDPDAAGYLVTTSPELATAVDREVERQLRDLPTAKVAREAVERNGAIVLVESDGEAMETANALAPEHLCLHDPALLPFVQNAGSVFLGPTSPEAAGDYVVGPNHVLPTGGASRSTGGLSVTHFLKVITTQELSPDALRALVPAAACLARAEGLEAHARSLEVRNA